MKQTKITKRFWFVSLDDSLDRSPNMSKTKVGVLGATGAVGQRLVRMLNGHPWFEIAAMAGSERTTGKQFSETVRPAPAAYGTISDDVLNMKLLQSEPASFDACAIVFSALT